MLLETCSITSCSGETGIEKNTIGSATDRKSYFHFFSYSVQKHCLLLLVVWHTVYFIGVFILCIPTSSFCLGGKPPSGLRYEYKNCWFWLQQWIHFWKQAGYILWESTICSPWTFPGKEVWWARGGCVESRSYPLYVGQRFPAFRWPKFKGIILHVKLTKFNVLNSCWNFNVNKIRW